MNTGIAWLGWDRGHRFVREAARDPRLQDSIQELLREFAVALSRITDFSLSELEAYVELARARSGNPHLNDPVDRFFRNLREKLGPDERFMKATLAYAEGGTVPKALIHIIALGYARLMRDEGLVLSYDGVRDLVRETSGLNEKESALLRGICDEVAGNSPHFS